MWHWLPCFNCWIHLTGSTSFTVSLAAPFPLVPYYHQKPPFSMIPLPPPVPQLHHRLWLVSRKWLFPFLDLFLWKIESIPFFVRKSCLWVDPFLIDLWDLSNQDIKSICSIFSHFRPNFQKIPSFWMIYLHIFYSNSTLINSLEPNKWERTFSRTKNQPKT